VIRYLNGGRQNEVQEFPIAHFSQLAIGRETACEIRFDANLDDLVSRQHARIEIRQSDPPEVELTDLGSRNGTFVNKHRIVNSAHLAPGDVVQLGPGGPEFEFDLEPRPVTVLRPTRVAELPGGGVPPTREGGTPEGTSQPNLSGPVGRATVERLIAHSSSRSNRTLWISVAALAVVVLAAVLWFGLGVHKPPVVADAGSKPPTVLTPSNIAQASTDSVAFLEVGWKLIDAESGRQLNHAYVPNETKDGNGHVKPLIPGAGKFVPLFVQLGNKIEPVLTTATAFGNGRYPPIGGRHSGSGFVVSSDGFILTNRHVAAAWLTTYHWPPQDRAGLLLRPVAGSVERRVILANEFPKWVPSQAGFVSEDTFAADAARLPGNAISGKNIEGRNDYLDVTFPKNRLRIPAKLARVSDHIDVAMIKIDLPRSVPKVELNDNYDSIQPGATVVAMGYPGVSPDVVGVAASQDPFNAAPSAKVIPEPTLSAGNVGRILRGHEMPGNSQEVLSEMGDVYQLTINSTGAGNSGGPVFDDQGRVIGIFTSGIRLDAMITFAVPIRYGMELMGTSKVYK
jgi:S1-C subfamily serine protease